ncbi:MAG: ClbS/DfsB family four-helix bundle protein [Bacteroidia bacterium]
MARPKTKAELLHLSKANFEKLTSVIDAFSTEEQNKEFPAGTMNRNIRDVLGHLHHWHLMMLDWHAVGMAGDKPDMPAKGYTWKTTKALNHWIWEQYKDTPLGAVRKLLVASYQDVQRIIGMYNDEELFEKKRYPWTGSTSLGAYLISASSSHYDWAWKLIKKANA